MRLLHTCMLAAALINVAVMAPAAAVGIRTPDSKFQLQSVNPGQPKAAPTKRPKGKKGEPADSNASDAKPADKKSQLDFREGYQLGYDAIYKNQDYAGGILILRALGQDDHPDVANLIGFSSRKLGHVDDAKVWYEKAIASDPSHTRTWQYYGMWHLEQGNRLKAEDHLERIRLICGQGCDDYTSLREALNGNMTY